MYDTFGNFDTYEEINTCAEGLLAEGDIEHIKTLAAENGLNDYMTEAYIEGQMPELTDWMNAAMGKLEVEGKAYRNNQIPVEPIIDYLRTLCIEKQFATAVRRKNKSIEKCMKLIEDNCKKIQKETGKHYAADLTVFHWARDYFLEG